MAGELQPLDEKFPIVGQDGRPTLYFIQWAQQRQIDIEQAASPEQVAEIVAQYITDHPTQWGDIEGALSAQTDLQTALNSKANLAGDTFVGPVEVPDDAYSAGWDGNTEVPTKNAIYDKIENMASSGAVLPVVDGSVPPNLVYLDDGSLVYAEIP